MYDVKVMQHIIIMQLRHTHSSVFQVIINDFLQH
jgi:hypothetical protein